MSRHIAAPAQAHNRVRSPYPLNGLDSDGPMDGVVYGRHVFGGVGDVLIESDETALAAAVEAASRTIAQIPYVTVCLGDRAGETLAAFAANLMLVSRLNFDEVGERARWFGVHFSARGLPRWISEQHLQHAARSVTHAGLRVPRYAAALMHAHNVLRDIRLSRMDEAQFNSLAADFVRSTTNSRHRIPAHTAEVILSAAIDAQTDVPGALRLVLALHSGLIAANPPWANAAEALVAAANRAAKPSPMPTAPVM